MKHGKCFWGCISQVCCCWSGVNHLISTATPPHCTEEHKSPEVMAINPRGQLPAFKDGDAIVNESFAAIIYLEERYADSGAQLLPKDPAARALVRPKAPMLCWWVTATRHVTLDCGDGLDGVMRSAG